MSNSSLLPASGELLALPDPVFVESEKPLQIQSAAAMKAQPPGREYSVISRRDDASQWQLQNGEDDELEACNFMQPRRDIEGKPTHIGLWVNGNGGWDRIIFELRAEPVAGRLDEQS